MLYATVRQRKVFVKKPTSIVRNSVNVDRLVLEMDDEWAAMTSIKCVFCLQYTEVTTSTETAEEEDGTTEEVTTTTRTTKEIKKEWLHMFGAEIPVPWECLTQTGKLSISCVGYVGDTQIMRTMKADSFWDVVLEGEDTGDEPLEATPTLYDQIIAASGAANAAAAAATEIGNDLAAKRDNGEFDGADGITPVVEIGTVQTGADGSEAQVNNTGTFPNVILNFVLPRGGRGPTGGTGPAGAPGATPYIGSNGNWWIGGEDTGHSSAGKEGPGGQPGVGIQSIVFKESNETGFVYTINLTDGNNYDFIAPRGPQGPGGGGGGEGGADGVGIQSIQLKETAETGNTYTIILTDGNSYDFVAPAGPAGKDGKDGKDGATGPAGYTPQAGTDYFTEADKQEIAQAAAALVEVPEGFSGSWNDLKDKPSAFPPATHNQEASTITSGTFDAARIPDLAASKITAGTFGGQVAANSSGQAAASYVVRNSKLAAAEEAPTVNGQICWVYE